MNEPWPVFSRCEEKHKMPAELCVLAEETCKCACGHVLRYMQRHQAENSTWNPFCPIAAVQLDEDLCTYSNGGGHSTLPIPWGRCALNLSPTLSLFSFSIGFMYTLCRGDKSPHSPVTKNSMHRTIYQNRFCHCEVWPCLKDSGSETQPESVVSPRQLSFVSASRDRLGLCTCHSFRRVVYCVPFIKIGGKGKNLKEFFR